MKGLNHYPYWIRAMVGFVLLAASVAVRVRYGNDRSIFSFMLVIAAVGIFLPERKRPAD
ncbi:hypothetical protein [Sphingobium sp. Z007]|uniref:hypothetical protein n=1 Tax=Sphingobium sp. Z007 TaxID=627495 RepID=UPI0015951FA4|nr:hypothetical protein [Sphingobium sp. Z007]